MRNIRKCLGLGLLSLALAASGPACAMAGQAGPGAAYKPSVNGISIYVSKKGNTVTLNRYNSTIGSWPAQKGVRCRGQGAAGRWDNPFRQVLRVYEE